VFRAEHFFRQELIVNTAEKSKVAGIAAAAVRPGTSVIVLKLIGRGAAVPGMANQAATSAVSFIDFSLGLGADPISIAGAGRLLWAFHLPMALRLSLLDVVSESEFQDIAHLQLAMRIEVGGFSQERLAALGYRDLQFGLALGQGRQSNIPSPGRIREALCHLPLHFPARLATGPGDQGRACVALEMGR
jgi:hypothetical protein